MSQRQKKAPKIGVKNLHFWFLAHLAPQDLLTSILFWVVYRKMAFFLRKNLFWPCTWELKMDIFGHRDQIWPYFGTNIKYGQISWPKDWYLIIFTNTFQLCLKFPSKWGITLILLRNDYLGPNLALFWPQYGQIWWPKDWYLSRANEYLPKVSFWASLMVK